MGSIAVVAVRILGALLKAITSPLAGPIAGAGCIVLGVSLMLAHGQVKARNATIRHQVGQIAHLSQELQLAVTNERGLTAAINRQNAAVSALKRDGDERVRRVESAATMAARGRSAAERRAGTIMAAKPSGDACKAAVSLIKGMG